MRKIGVLILLMFLYGCIHVVQDLNDQNLEGISTQMTKQEVAEKIGEPASVKTIVKAGKEYEVWQYPIKRRWAKRFNTLDKSSYEIFFFDGKVSHWDRVKVYAQPDYQFEEPDSSGKGGVTVEFLKK